MNKESFSFVVYMIHACANKWNMMPSEVYQKLQSVGCIQCYLVPHYDILHTQGTSYIVDDIKRYLEVRGGVQYLDFKVLVQILCETERELFA